MHVFDLEGHPRATRAYAWSSRVEGSERRRFYAVLHLRGIRSPLDAVRAAIGAERHLSNQERSAINDIEILVYVIATVSGCAALWWKVFRGDVRDHMPPIHSLERVDTRIW